MLVVASTSYSMVPSRNVKSLSTACPVLMFFAWSPAFNSIASNPLCWTKSARPDVVQWSEVMAILSGSAAEAAATIDTRNNHTQTCSVGFSGQLLLEEEPWNEFVMTRGYLHGRAPSEAYVRVRTGLL